MNQRRMTRRAVLRGAARGAVAAATAGAATTLGGCGLGGGGRIEVVVPWSGNELDLFNQVLDPYRREGHDVDVISESDNSIDAFLRNRHRAGNPPDVAVLSRPGLMRDYADRGWLKPLTRLGEGLDQVWRDVLTTDQSDAGRSGARRDLYGVWLKATQKSWFWYRERFAHGLSPFTTWDDLVAWVSDAVTREGPPPLAVGAADGWVLADWFENLLVVQSPAQYENLASGDGVWRDDRVRATLHNLADVWGIPGIFPGGGQRALLTQFDQSVLQVDSGEASMLQADESVITHTDSAFSRFPFPAPSGAASRALVTGGDLAVVFEGSSTGIELVEWLTRRDFEAFDIWRHQGYLSPHDIELSPGVDLHFGLFDRLQGELTGAEGGSWQVLQDFFANVTVARPDVDGAVETAIDGLHEVALRAHDLTPEPPDSGRPRAEGGTP